MPGCSSAAASSRWVPFSGGECFDILHESGVLGRLTTRRYDIGIFSTIYVSPGFKKALNSPSSSDTGLITAIFYLGQFVGFAFLSGPTNNRLGRRWAGFVGVVVLCLGAVFQTAAVHIGMMIVGRIIAGLGTGIVSTSVPLYLSEISPAEHRGLYVAFNQVGIVFG